MGCCKRKLEFVCAILGTLDILLHIFFSLAYKFFVWVLVDTMCKFLKVVSKYHCLVTQFKIAAHGNNTLFGWFMWTVLALEILIILINMLLIVGGLQVHLCIPPLCVWVSVHWNTFSEKYRTTQKVLNCYGVSLVLKFDPIFGVDFVHWRNFSYFPRIGLDRYVLHF